MKDLKTFIIESLDNLVNDYEKSEYVSGNEKKQLAEKYGCSNKIKDIQKAILLKMRDERHTRKEFNDKDITYFSRLDFPERDFVKYLSEEPIEFVRFYADFYLNKLKAKKLDRMVGQKLNGYNSSIADRFMIKRYEAILTYLTENDKPLEEIAKDKAAKERAEMMMQNLVAKLQEELKDFKKKLLDFAKEFATKKYNNIPKLIEKYNNFIKEYETNNEGKSWSVRSKEYREVEKVIKERNKCKALITRYKTLKDYQDACIKEAEDQFNYNVNAIANRVSEKGLNIEQISCKNIFNDPKFIEMTITDGNKNLYCRSILAAEYSDKMIPHFRFIITEKNK